MTVRELGDGKAVYLGFNIYGPDADENSVQIFANALNWITGAGCPLDLTVTPDNPPIVIPRRGGVFSFDGMIVNTSETTQWFDAWTEAILPNQNTYGPIILVENIGLQPFGVMTPQNVRTQVPRFAPAGEYLFIVKIGNYPVDVCAEASFPFTKLAAGIDGEGFDEWAASGWDEESGTAASPVPTEFGIESAYPNPFNPSTSISVALPDLSLIHI